MNTESLEQLENPSEFVARHIGITPDDEQKMLAVIGEKSRQSLIDSIVPRSIARQSEMKLPPAVMPQVSAGVPSKP